MYPGQDPFPNLSDVNRFGSGVPFALGLALGGPLLNVLEKVCFYLIPVGWWKINHLAIQKAGWPVFPIFIQISQVAHD